MFYNPAMAVDRDIAVAFVLAWSRGRGRALTGWEMMAATGARGLRLAGETDAFVSFTLTEANPDAFQVLAENSRSVPGARPLLANARDRPGDAPFDYVDLDPYGTPAPFVPVALAAVRPGGVLAVTATDMTVLAGAQPEACRRRYGARPVRGRLGPEGGLRILLAFLARGARAQGRAIRPLLSYVGGHHVRAFVELSETSSVSDPVREVRREEWSGPPLGSLGSYGPLWLGPIFDAALVGGLRVPASASDPRAVEAFLRRIQEEVAVDVPFYYEPNGLAESLSLPYPPARDRLFDGLHARGFRSVRTHTRPEGFRTDAPRTIVEEVAREASGQR